ncbi:MAG: tRNA pseudouridine(38-40) synthase TruA [Clostridiaceae bacterium]|nr:tRNA pseudouridine(38-40) synthase TruA [Clostridiaceae bacterium]
MMNIRLILQFDGTRYYGWQKQKKHVTVQSVVEKALSKLLDQDIDLIGCSRTDAGVHALCYNANFHAKTNIPPDKISFAVNPLLPEDIVVVESCLVSDDFHARYDAKSKTYKYLVHASPKRNPLLNNRVWHVNRALDLNLMQKAAVHIQGKREYDAFRAQGGYAKTTTRTIFHTIVKQEYLPNIYSIEVCGDGFLYNMVRIIAGTLVYVGLGKISPDNLSMIIESKDRTKAGITAPPHGLYLYDVSY